MPKGGENLNIFALWGEIEINRQKAESDIVAVEKQAEKSGKKMESSFDKVTKVVATAIKEIDKYGDKVEKFGKNLTKKVAVPLAGLTALMGGLAKKTADYGDQMAKASQEVGMNVVAYQELTYVLGQNNLGAEESLRVFGRLNQRIGLARKGNENYRKSLERMGVSMDALDDGLIGTEEAFEHIIEYLSGMEDSQLQAAYASDIFGTMLSRKMMPLIRSGSEGVAELRDRARELGIVLDEEFAERSEVFGDTMDDLKQTASGLSRAFGKELLAPLINIGRVVTDVIAGMSRWVSENPKLVRQIIMWGGAIVGVLGVLFTLGTTLTITGKIIGALGTAMNILISKPMLIIAALALLWVAWENDWGNIRTTTETVIDVIIKLWDSLVDWWDTSPLLAKIREIWEDAVALWDEMTLPEKALGLITVTATITWGLTFLKTFLSTLLPMAGINKATGTAATLGKYMLALGALVVLGNIVWNLIPEDIQNKVQKLWQGVANAIENFNIKTIKNPFISKLTEWLNGLNTEGWEIPALTVGVAFATFKLLQNATVIAGLLGTALMAVLTKVAIPLGIVSAIIAGFWWLFSDDEERKALAERINKIWEDDNLSLFVKVGKIALDIADTVYTDVQTQLENFFAKVIKDLTGKTPYEWGSALYDWLFPDDTPIGGDGFGGGGGGVRGGTDSGPASAHPQHIPRLPTSRNATTTEFDNLLESIYRAEGGANARVPYGMTGFADAGNKFGNASNQALFEEMSQGMVEGSDEYYRTAALVSAQHYWNTFAERFPGIAGQTFEELSPEMQQMFVLHMGRWFSPPEAHELNKNWVPNVLNALGHDDVADQFRAGGQNIMDAWVDGIYDKADDVEAVADYISGILADYIVGQSPPPEGPLSDVDEGGANIGEAWVEGVVEGVEENESLLSKAVGKIKELLSGVWEQVPENIRQPIEDAIQKAENALFKLEDLQDELDALMNPKKDPEEEAKGFMERLFDSLDEKLKAVEVPLDRFVGAISDASLQLVEVGKALASGNWLDALLSILMETESFAKAMELIGKVLDPVVALFDLVLKPIINGILRLWNGVIDALASISIFGWKPFENLKNSKVTLVGEDDKKGGRDSGTKGRQVSEITGPTRDLLTDLMTPLANFGQIIAPVQDIRDILDTRLPNFNSGFEFAGAGAMGGNITFESGSILINSNATNAAELSRDMLDQIERALAGRVAGGIRGRGGR